MQNSKNDNVTATNPIEVVLQRFAEDGDTSARDELIGLACDRMRAIAHRMLRTFPGVQRWEQTDDIVQNAAMRLYRALAEVTPRTARDFSGLAALQIRRELLDLAKKHVAIWSYAANHETNVRRVDGELAWKIADAAAPNEPHDEIERWAKLHELAGALPEDERDLFHLAWYLGINQEEAAKLLGVSLRTVKRRWESAKNLIRLAMGGDPPV